MEKVFKSTQPEWAATKDKIKNGTSRKDLNPRSPSGLRPENAYQQDGRYYHLNPRSPSGLRRAVRISTTAGSMYLNPRSPSGLRQYKNKL